jgi:uncharacterized membrane protein YkvA (DUF1232 family)
MFLFRLIRHLPNFIRLLWRLFRDPRVPLYLKGMLIVAGLYVLSPLDIFPDYLPFLGQLDDLSLLLLAGYYFVKWSPRDVVEEHVARIDKTLFEKFQRPPRNPPPHV